MQILDDKDKGELIHLLKNGKLEIEFEKKNGELRVMVCTLSSEFIPSSWDVENPNKPKRKKNEDILAVFDIETKSWRSFRWVSLKSYKKVT